MSLSIVRGLGQPLPSSSPGPNILPLINLSEKHQLYIFPGRHRRDLGKGKGSVERCASFVEDPLSLRRSLILLWYILSYCNASLGPAILI